MGTFIDITGLKYGRLTVIKFDKRIGNKYMWMCICSCGKQKSAWSGSLKNGNIKSCGCFRLEVMATSGIKHGFTKGRTATPEYRSWQSMKKRCLNKKDKNYSLYGGRGIKIHKEWVHDFEAFYKYIGNRPSYKHSLDRFPNKNGNYEPNNVRWATQTQQMQNVSRNVVITFNGKTMVLAEWGRYFGVTGCAIKFHLNNGRTIEQIAAYYKYKRDSNITTWIPFQTFD